MKSHELPDKSYYILRGTVAAHEFAGSLKFYSISTSEKAEEYLVHGSELDEPVTAHHRLIDGRYSNVRYIPESGDLVGTELFLLHTEGRISGLIIFYEGYWGEPVSVSLAILNVRILNDETIEFQLKLGNGEGKYVLQRQKDAAILSRADVAPSPNAETVRLLYQHALLPD